VIEQEDRPDRKTYTITAEGRQELRRWLLRPLPPEKARDAHLIHVFFAGQLDDQAIVAMLAREAGASRDLVARYDQVHAASEPYVEMAGSARETFFWMLTLDFGVRMAQARLDWLESVIERKDHPLE
jgi:PadR family transcriptional regulator AphA